jgi:hypothetical protein
VDFPIGNYTIILEIVKRPERKRDQVRRQFGGVPEGVDLDAIAAAVRYVGSPEHKNTPSFAGPPLWKRRPRADSSLCDPSLANRLQEINEWLQTAIRQRQFIWHDQAFPRYVYARIDTAIYEARLTNHVTGEYKGYELYPEQIPKELI